MYLLHFRLPRRYGNGPGSSGENTGGENGGTGNTDPGNNGGNDNNGGTGGGTPPEPKPFDLSTLSPEARAAVQAEHDRIAAKTREDEKKKYERKLADDKTASEAAAAAKRGEFEKLYNDEKAAHEATKTKATKADTFAEQINKHIDGEIGKWPAEVKKTDPGKDNVEARMAWVETHRDLAAAIASGRRAPASEHGQGSGGAGTGNTNYTNSYVGNTYGRPDKKPEK